MTSARTKLAETLRSKTQDWATRSLEDTGEANRMLAYVQAETARTELERRGVCDVAWMMIDSETDWRMHKKLAGLKYVWTVTVTLEHRALKGLDTEAIRELVDKAGDGYDRHLIAKSSRRRGRGDRASQATLRSARVGQ